MKKHNCNGTRKRTGLQPNSNEWFLSKLNDIGSNIIPLELYTGNRNKMLVKCINCEYEWIASPANILRHHTYCPSCNQHNSTHWMKSNSTFINELYTINQNIIPLTEYCGVFDEMSFSCKKCNYIWKTKPSLILKSGKCPNCERKHNVGELLTARWLDNNHITYIPQHTFDELINIRKLHVDFYIPEYNTVLEVDGNSHHDPIRIFGGKAGLLERINRDRIKSQYCLEHSIPIIRLNYTGRERWQLKAFNLELNTKLSKLLPVHSLDFE